MLSVSMRLMSMRCVRLRMVSSSLSGSSLTITNTVLLGGSSMSFSSLLAHSWFMRSGSHITDTLYPPWLDLRLSLRARSSLSPAVMMACWFSPSIISIHWFIVK